MSNMFEIIGTSNPAYLLASPIGCDLISVPVKPGQGTVNRGTLLYRGTNGMYAVATATEVTTGYSLVVLDETVNTNASMTVAEDVRAYRAGRFLYGKVYLGASTTITAAQALVLRMQGIVFDRLDDGTEYDNQQYTVTYVANNSVTPAEDDVVNYKTAGIAYTILNNSDSSLSFTAPSGKSWSKWNTKADGTGTDYAAAATYSTDANLTLYAVWA